MFLVVSWPVKQEDFPGLQRTKIHLSTEARRLRHGFGNAEHNSRGLNACSSCRAPLTVPIKNSENEINSKDYPRHSELNDSFTARNCRLVFSTFVLMT